MKPAPWDSIFAEKEHAWLDPDPWVSSFLSRFAQGARLLDVGCGCGRHLRRAFLSGLVAVGLDESSVALGLASDCLRAIGQQAWLLRGDFSALPFRSGSFDIVISTYSANHGTRRQITGYFSELARVLCQGGSMAVILSASGDYREGIGDQLEAHTYVLTDGPESGVPHHFATEELVRECLGFASHMTCELHTMSFPEIEAHYGSPVHLKSHPVVLNKVSPMAANWRLTARK